jgi:hypothetical protein
LRNRDRALLWDNCVTTAAATEELMDRLLRDPPGDIPKRNIDGREAVHKSAATPEDMEFLLQIEAQLAKLPCVPTDTFGGKYGIDNDIDRRNGGKAECFTLTNDAGIGYDRDNQRVDRLQTRLAPHPRI